MPIRFVFPFAFFWLYFAQDGRLKAPQAHLSSMPRGCEAAGARYALFSSSSLSFFLSDDFNFQQEWPWAHWMLFEFEFGPAWPTTRSTCIKSTVSQFFHLLFHSLHLTNSSQQTSRLESSPSSPWTTALASCIEVVRIRQSSTAYDDFVKLFCLKIISMINNFLLQGPRKILSAAIAQM